MMLAASKAQRHCDPSTMAARNGARKNRDAGKKPGP